MYDRDTGDEDRQANDPTLDQIEAIATQLRSLRPEGWSAPMDGWLRGETAPAVLRRLVSWPGLCERQRLKSSEMGIDQ